MKHKKTLALIILSFIVYVIYTCFHTNKLNYLALGDSLSVGINSYGEEIYSYSDYISFYLEKNNLLKHYTKAFSNPTNQIHDVKNQLETNQTIQQEQKDLSLKKCLRESDLVTLSVGMSDLLTKLNLTSLDVSTLDEKEIIPLINNTVTDLEALFKQLRTYAKRKIVFLGYYNPFPTKTLQTERIFAYLNYQVKKLCKKYDIKYIDIDTLLKKDPAYLPNPTNIHPSAKGYEAISEKIIQELNFWNFYCTIAKNLLY